MNSYQYSTIAEDIILKIKQGHYTLNQKLPSENELSYNYHCSRGTIRQALSALESLGVICKRQGVGSVVLSAKPVDSTDKAKDIISALFSSLHNPDQILKAEKQLKEQLLQKYTDHNHIKVLWTDCCPEILLATQIQLKSIPNIKLTPLNLYDVLSSPSIINNYDVLLTTQMHYKELAKVAVGSQIPIEVLSLDLDIPTTIALSRLNTEVLGIICISDRFFSNVQTALLQLNKSNQAHQLNLSKNIKKLLFSCQVLILPPQYSQYESKSNLKILEDFKQQGGTIIEFNYLIDKGSLLHFTTKLENYKNNI